MPLEENFDNVNLYHTVDGEYVFKEGETFDDYEELMHRMDLHTKESLVYYWRRDSRTVEKAYTKTSRPIASKLKFYLVRFACVYGGMKFQPRGVGRRVGQSFRTNCPAHILLRASKCGQKLEVITVCNNHNHDISQKALALLPHNRKLPKDIKDEVIEMLKLKIDKKKIIEYVRERSKKTIKLKDLFNLAATLKTSIATENEDNKSSGILQNIYSFTTDRSIQSAIQPELPAMDSDPNMYFPEEDNDIIELSPEYDFGVNETITDQWEDETLRDVDADEIYTSQSDINTNIEVEKFDFYENMIVMEDGNFEVDELMTNNTGSDEDFKVDEEKHESIESTESTESTTDEIKSNVEEDKDVVYFEITIDKCDEKVGQNEETNSNNSKPSDLESEVRRTIKKTVKCRKCGTNSKLLHSQIRYLKAKKDKLLAETNVLVLRKRKLKMEIAMLNDIKL